MKVSVKDGSVNDAWIDYRKTVEELCTQFDEVNILEIGGGRAPLFALNDLPPNVVSYTVNDIDSSELDRLDKGYLAASFDACGDVTPYAGHYDLVISKMLAEHVTDGKKFHENVYRLLKPSGISFHFFPKLYAFPFVINYLLPERVSYRILTTLFPNRRSEFPKFPAHYSWCHGTSFSISSRIKNLGFHQVCVINFYGHSYYKSFPVLRNIEIWYRNLCKKWELSLFSSFVYVIAQKSVSENSLYRSD